MRIMMHFINNFSFSIHCEIKYFGFFGVYLLAIALSLSLKDDFKYLHHCNNAKLFSSLDTVHHPCWNAPAIHTAIFRSPHDEL